jgi:hypothetical protein
MTEHTPTPWRSCPYSQDIYADNVPKGPMRVADIRGWGYLTGKGHGALGLSNEEALATQIANAALIVKAVNNHASLVGALRFILAFYEPGQRYLDTEAWKVAEAGARRALKDAEAGT